MANMSYCRFENTVQDLRDCFYHMDEKLDSDTEKRARKQLIDLCNKITMEFGEYDEEE